MTMKTPQVPAIPSMSPLGRKHPSYPYQRDPQTGLLTATLNPLTTDQKIVAERQWQKRKLAPAPQKPCDHGLFSDDANQRELF